MVLLYFNTTDGTESLKKNMSLSFLKLLEMTNLPDEILKRILHSLSCGKYRILKRLQGSASRISTEAKETNEGMMYCTTCLVGLNSYERIWLFQL